MFKAPSESYVEDKISEVKENLNRLRKNVSHVERIMRYSLIEADLTEFFPDNKNIAKKEIAVRFEDATFGSEYEIITALRDFSLNEHFHAAISLAVIGKTASSLNNPELIANGSYVDILKKMKGYMEDHVSLHEDYKSTFFEKLKEVRQRIVLNDESEGRLSRLSSDFDAGIKKSETILSSDLSSEELDLMARNCDLEYVDSSISSLSAVINQTEMFLRYIHLFEAKYIDAFSENDLKEYISGYREQLESIESYYERITRDDNEPDQPVIIIPVIFLK